MTPHQAEVIASMDGFVESQLTLLKPVEECWQPVDFLPDLTREDWKAQVLQIREAAAAISDELLVVLVGDMITEEALPTYMSWLNRLDGVRDETGASDTPWAQWTRGWSAEENRHGDILNRYLYLSGRVDMRAVEVTIHHLIRNGFDPQTGHDPYLGFVYTSFQERGTRISHGNVSTLARKAGDSALGKLCSMVAGDEAQHEKAYKAFMSHVFERDPTGAILAFETMMRSNIVMPAIQMKDGSGDSLFRQFSAVAQSIGVYTAKDYAEIIGHLVRIWKVADLCQLSGDAARAQDYLCGLENRYERLADRTESRMAKEKPKPISWIFGRSV